MLPGPAAARAPSADSAPSGLPLDAADIEAEAAAARFRWARAAGHPHYLWPDVPFTAWRQSLEAIAGATREVLLGKGARLDAPCGPRPLGIAALTSGMGPLLGYWSCTSRLQADPAVSAVLRFHLEHGRRRWERMAGELSRVTGILADAGMDVTVLKGAHTALSVFPEPGTRPSADLDLLIPPRHVSLATQLLQDAGYRAISWTGRPHKSEWLPPGETGVVRSLDVTHAGNPITIELHVTLARTFHGVRVVRVEPGPHSDPWPGGAPGVRVLTPPVLLAFLAVHTSEELHHLQLIRLVELVLVARGRAGTPLADWPATIALLTRTGALRFAYPALELAERLVPGTVPPDARRTLAEAVPPRMRRALARLSPATAQQLDGLDVSDRFMWVNGPLEWIRRAGFLLWPQSGGRGLGDMIAIYHRRLRRLTRGRVTIGRGPAAR